MATKKKMLQAAAGNAGGAGLNVEDVFSTYLYTGNGSTQTITNGVDLSGEGGLVWIKNRTDAYSHFLTDTERGTNSQLSSDSSLAAATSSVRVTGFNADGFDLGGNGATNGSSNNIVSWTFRKAPKFFDVVTWTGDGTNNRKIPHNLGSAPGCYFVKQVNDGRGWSAYHRGVNGGTNPEQYIMVPSDTDAQNNVIYWNDTAPTSTEFTINSSTPINESGGTYIAYLWAHNNGDGEFGPDADADAIKCGSYSGNGSTTGPVIDLGFEPQWVMIKNTSSAGDWTIFDSLRGVATGGNDSRLHPNTTQAESDSADIIDFNSTGFQLTNVFADYNASGDNYIYIAIRRPTAVPTSATEVFAVAPRTNTIPGFASGFPVDFLIGARTINGADNNEIKTRLISGGYLRANTTGAETVSDQTANFAHNDGFFNFAGANANQYAWMWKRAPKYMDVVAYTGNGTAGRTVSHNLGVAPEMIWVKNRGDARNWIVYSPLGTTKWLELDNTQAAQNENSGFIWNQTAPTDSVFSLGTWVNVNASANTYIAYLFASLAGISKVGSVTHSGTTNVDCGFTSGARFVLLKRTDATGDWYVWDSVRGIVSGNDPYLLLNSTAAEVTNTDYIDPLSSGFTITSSFTAGDYIFYAIA